MERIKLIFIGTGTIGGKLLKQLHSDDRFMISMVVTGKDKHSGRKMELKPSPIKVIANDLNLPIFQPDNINTKESLTILNKVGASMVVLMAYGQILSKDVLNITPFGCLNIHASLLPKYRGASPIQAAILNQDNTSGISLMKMVEQMDAGPVYKSFTLAIEKNDNQKTLTEKLANLSSQKIPDTLIMVFEKNIKSQNQIDDDVTYVKKISKEDGVINWNDNVRVIDAKIRAFYGWPGTFTFFRGKRLKIISASYKIESVSKNPGTITENGIICANGLIKPIEVQLEGKKIQTIEEFINGNPNFIGYKL